MKINIGQEPPQEPKKNDGNDGRLEVTLTLWEETKPLQKRNKNPWTKRLETPRRFFSITLLHFENPRKWLTHEPPLPLKKKETRQNLSCCQKSYSPTKRDWSCAKNEEIERFLHWTSSRALIPSHQKNGISRLSFYDKPYFHWEKKMKEFKGKQKKDTAQKEPN